MPDGLACDLNTYVSAELDEDGKLEYTAECDATGDRDCGWLLDLTAANAPPVGTETWPKLDALHRQHSLAKARPTPYRAAVELALRRAILRSGVLAAKDDEAAVRMLLRELDEQRTVAGSYAEPLLALVGGPADA